MSKRKVHFAEGDGLHEEIPAEKQSRATRFKEKHSLDSDEEDAQEKDSEKLDVDAIEGQEEGDVDFDEGTKITPFNMKEEMEEGHFDKDGMYIFDKKKEIQDNWIDNIDWVKVKETENTKYKYGEYDSDEDSSSEPEKVDEIQTYRQMLELMKPGETVLKAIRRLGGSNKGKSSSASQRWKKQKTGTGEGEAGVDKEAMLKLTGFADALLTQGDQEVYSDTYEKFAFKVKTADEQAEAQKLNIPDGTSADDALDMFADDMDEKVMNKPSEKTSEDSKMETDAQNTPSTSKNTQQSDAALDPPSSAITWEYKWKEDDEEIHGPFSSEQMLEWQEDGFFKNGVLCRKVGQDTQFYNSRRIDFDLYT